MLAENWGATTAERAVPLGCDELLPGARFRLHRAISVAAPPATVYRWLCQLRRAPYSYDLLDNFGRHSPSELTPGLEQLATGQRFMTIFGLAAFEPGREITLEAEDTAVTYAALAFGKSSRLLVRILCEPRSEVIARAAQLLALGDLVMMRKQLLTLKDLAENET